MRRHAAVVLLAAGVLLAGCGGGGKKAASFNEVQAKADVTAAYTTVFTNGQGTLDQKIAAIEDGSSLKAFLLQLANTPQGKAKTSIKVDKVTFPTHTTAAVNFTITLNGAPFPLTGKAVLKNGTWVVAKDTFCGLATQAGGVKAPAACSLK